MIGNFLKDVVTQPRMAMLFLTLQLYSWISGMRWKANASPLHSPVGGDFPACARGTSVVP